MMDMEKMLCKLLWSQLQSIGLFGKGNVTINELKDNARLLGMYDRWFEETVEMLICNHYLEYGEGCLIVNSTTPVDLKTVWSEWDKNKVVWFDMPGMKAKVVLAEAIMKTLPEILNGEIGRAHV